MTKINEPSLISKYKFQTCSKNPDFLSGKLIPFIPCQEYNKSSKGYISNIVTGAPVYDHIFGVVETIPKWITVLVRPDGNIYMTNNLRSGRNRKIKTVERFFNYYEPLYQKRIVSVLLVTLTRINFAKLNIITFLECIKVRLEALKWHLRGYLWVMELKSNKKILGGFHLHYHLVLAVDRVRIEKLPKELRLSELWGQRTEVKFVKKTVRGYLSKYLYKSEGKVNGYRNYGISKKLL